MCSRLTGCAGYVFDSGDYGRLRFFLRCVLLQFCIYVMHMAPRTVLCIAAFWNRDLCNVLKLEKLLHNCDWYSLTWFAWIRVLLLVWCTCIPSKCIYSLPRLIWNARHAWTLALTLQFIMILHQRECEPITSVHWARKHDVCSTISDLPQLSRDTGLERHKVRESFL